MRKSETYRLLRREVETVYRFTCQYCHAVHECYSGCTSIADAVEEIMVYGWEARERGARCDECSRMEIGELYRLLEDADLEGYTIPWAMREELVILGVPVSRLDDAGISKILDAMMGSLTPRFNDKGMGWGLSLEPTDNPELFDLYIQRS